MQTESLGRVLPQILLPYLQQWAERSGLNLLSRLLVDEQFRGLIEKYGDELMTHVAQTASSRGNRQRNGSRPASGAQSNVSENDANANDLASLHERVLVMEAQQKAQQALFEVLRTKIRPLALALGCCPECLVGVDGCPKCWGRSKVAQYPPDYTLLETEIVGPLALRGVPLVLNEIKVSSKNRQSTDLSATKRRTKS